MPFGEQIANTTGTRSDNSFKYSSNEDDVNQKFTGYQQDGETMLDFAEARMYENRHARFTAVDPLLASGNSANPQTFNRYVYVRNNPINLADPDGLCDTGNCPSRWRGSVYYRYDDDGNRWFNNDPNEGGYKWNELEDGTYITIYDSVTGRSFEIYNQSGVSGWRAFEGDGDPQSMLPRRWRNFTYLGAQARSWEGISARVLMQTTLTSGDFEDRDIEKVKDLKDSGKVTALMNMGQFANFGGMRSPPNNHFFKMPPPTKKITVYRGVNSGGEEAYTNALKGIVKPRGGRFGHSNPLLHNTGKGGTEKSAFTSWTTDKDVAINFAYRGRRKFFGNGVLLQMRIKESTFLKNLSPNKKEVRLFHNNRGTVSENEVLLKGVFKGVNFKKINF